MEHRCCMRGLGAVGASRPGRSRATQCRRRRPEPDSAAVIERRRAAHPRALSDDERAEVLEVLHSDRFVDESPTTVWATLLDEGRYLASPATMYRLLRAAHGTVIERRRQAAHPPRSRPELAAQAPNDIWSWDITGLRGPANGTSSASACCWTCSRATCRAGCSPPSRTPSSPAASSTRPSPATTSTPRR